MVQRGRGVVGYRVNLFHGNVLGSHSWVDWNGEWWWWNTSVEGWEILERNLRLILNLLDLATDWRARLLILVV